MNLGRITTDMEFERLYGSFSERDWETGVSGTVRFALCGLGWWTLEEALPAIRESDRATVTALVSRSKEKAERVAAEADVEYGLSEEEYHAGEAAAAYDAVYVATPNATHLAYVRTAADLEKAVLCEKPMERDSDRARALVETCESAGVDLMVAYRMHTEPAVRRARELVEAGYVGEPMEVRGDMSQRLLDRINPDPDQWRLDEELAGGGALFDIGIYPLNTARFLLDADPVAVTGRTASTHAAFDDVDETVTFTLEFPDDVYAACYASHNARQSSAITVTGTEGQVRVEPAFFQDQTRELHVSRGDGRASVELSRVDQMREEFDYFADRVRGDAAIHPDGEHGLVDVVTMEAVYEAVADCTWVAVD